MKSPLIPLLQRGRFERRTTMKKILIVLCLVLSAPTVVQAYGLDKDQEGFVFGAGALGGFEYHQIKRFGGGLATQFGYRLNKNLAIFLETDVTYFRKVGVNYFFIPVMPTVQYFIYEGAYAYAGGGYEFSHVSDGTQFGVPAISRNYNAWAGDAGAGYEFWIDNSLTFAPQVGFHYTRISQSNLFTPTIRVNLAYHF